MANPHGASVKSVQRAMEILEVFSGPAGELGISEISTKMGLNKSTVYGLVNTLASGGYLEQNLETKRYRLGVKLFEMGSLVQRRFDLRNETRPYCCQLSDQYRSTVHLAAHYDNEIVYIDKVDSPDALVQYSQLGRRAPMYCTGVGKAILANLPQEEREHFYNNVKLQSFTQNTITTKENLERELELIRRCGYAVDNEEIQENLQCVAAPFFDYTGRPVAAISVSMPHNRMSPELFDEIAGKLVGISDKISSRMGYLHK